MRRDEVGTLVEHAQAVGITVIAEGQVVFAGEHHVPRGDEILRDGLRIYAAERGIDVPSYAVDDRLLQRLDVAADDARRADVVDAQDSRWKLRGRSVNGVVQDGQLRAADLRHVDLRAQSVDVIVQQILFCDRPALTRGTLAERVSDRFVGLRQRRAAIPRLELDPVVLRRIVAGRDDHSAENLAMRRGEGDRL